MKSLTQEGGIAIEQKLTSVNRFTSGLQKKAVRFQQEGVIWFEAMVVQVKSLTQEGGIAIEQSFTSVNRFTSGLQKKAVKSQQKGMVWFEAMVVQVKIVVFSLLILFFTHEFTNVFSIISK